jgi:hypothetical protein
MAVAYMRMTGRAVGPAPFIQRSRHPVGYAPFIPEWPTASKFRPGTLPLDEAQPKDC